ncbi:PH domain-containing protein [Stenotrophomonas sp. YIM B06876]|uniref:PH domain-containing protein n=1 Tax=Stenotrophomonas sp. YIM B06876 TaxID=3060211 RepID=UPI002739E48C|nr:PH domain-containing protein [Stenotrophomonas sp. YIM B06876]
MPGAPLPEGWQALPRRGALLAAAGAGLTLALTLMLAVGGLSLVLRSGHLLASGAVAAAAGLLVGGGFGWRRHRLTFWQLDGQGLAVRRGHLWQSDTRVPISRVQHLDLRRGPLQRAAHLATLVVHTAGSRFNTVAVAGLDQADAEHLRDRLAHQLDHDDGL